MNPVLSVRNLTTSLQFGKRIFPAVSDVSFDLYPGKTIAIVGESGCGKTMTALSLMRILPQPPALHPQGEVILDGVDLLSLSETEMREVRGKKLSMIFQDPQSSLNPVYTIGEQLLEVIDDEEAAIQALKEVGIGRAEEIMDAYPHELSGGMKQRVMIAMAMLFTPLVLIADEPTTALDVTIQKQVLDLMKKLQKEHGTAIVLITHDMGVVSEMADDVIVLYGTKVMERGTRDEVLKNPRHPYTQGLLASLPQMHRPKEKLRVIPGMVPSLQHMPDGCPFHPRCPYVMEKCRHGLVPSFDGVHCWLYY